MSAGSPQLVDPNEHLVAHPGEAPWIGGTSTSMATATVTTVVPRRKTHVLSDDSNKALLGATTGSPSEDRNGFTGNANMRVVDSAVFDVVKPVIPIMCVSIDGSCVRCLPTDSHIPC
jgi:hypothetical protein